jgi:hypothetical protein
MGPTPHPARAAPEILPSRYYVLWPRMSLTIPPTIVENTEQEIPASARVASIPANDLVTADPI